MQNTLPMSRFLFPNPSIFDPIFPNNTFSARICSPISHLNRSPPRVSTITCARSSNKGFFGSQRSRKTLIQLARFAASNLHYVLPEPLNSVVRELGGGNGGGGGGIGGSRKGFGWGGFDGGRKRRAKRKLGFWVWGLAVVCCCLGFLRLVFGGELELGKDVLLGALCLTMFLALVRHGCVPEWVLGFCSGGALVGLAMLKRDEFKSFVNGFKAMGIAKRRKKGRRVM